MDRIDRRTNTRWNGNDSEQIVRESPPESIRRVLVAEDHEPTARLISTAFDEVSPACHTIVVGDGERCLEALRENDGTTGAPDLLLLDFDLPELDGLGVLERTNEEPEVRDVPTIVLSDRNDPQTFTRCIEAGAAAFFSKPDDYDGYLMLATCVAAFWFVSEDIAEMIQ